MSMLETACIAFGGNVGDVVENFRRAAQLLNAAPGIQVLRESRIFRTVAVGSNAGDDFLNAAVLVETRLKAIELLEVLIDVETHLQRKRRVHWGPRTIDLDLIFYGEQVICESRLNVPHPSCWYRRFVLDPVADLCPEWIHPLRLLSIRALLQHFEQQPLRMLLLGSQTSVMHNVRAHLVENFESRIEVETRDMESDDREWAPFHLIAWNLEQKLKVSPLAVSYEELPRESRLDVSLLPGDAYTCLVDVIRAATDIPEPERRFPEWRSE